MNYKNVKWYYDYGQELVSLFDKVQPQGHSIGFYSPSKVGWSYEFKIVKYKNKIYEVMTRFGCVEGVRELYLSDNKVSK